MSHVVAVRAPSLRASSGASPLSSLPAQLHLFIAAALPLAWAARAPFFASSARAWAVRKHDLAWRARALALALLRLTSVPPDAALSDVGESEWLRSVLAAAQAAEPDRERRARELVVVVTAGLARLPSPAWRYVVLVAGSARNLEMLRALRRAGVQLAAADSASSEVQLVAGRLAWDGEVQTLAELRLCGLTVAAFDLEGARAVTHRVETLRELLGWERGEPFVHTHVARSSACSAEVLRELRVVHGYARSFVQRENNRVLRNAVAKGLVDVLRELREWGLGEADARAIGPHRLLNSALRAPVGVLECVFELAHHWHVPAGAMLVLSMVVAQQSAALRALRLVYGLGVDAVRGKPLVHAASAGLCEVLRELRDFGLAPRDARLALVVAAGKARLPAVHEILSWGLLPPSEAVQLPQSVHPTVLVALRAWQDGSARS